MAGIYAVSSFCDSLAQFLGNTYPEELRDQHPCQFRVISSHELDEEDFGTSVTVYVYRIIVNEYLRNTKRQTHTRNMPPLSVDLHIMMSIWAESAEAEQTIGSWVMRQLYLHPILDQSALTSEGEWQSGDIVHIIPAELSNEDLMRIWDAVTPSYRLSLSYIARSIRIDPLDRGSDLPVVATRFQFQTEEPTDA